MHPHCLLRPLFAAAIICWLGSLPVWAAEPPAAFPGAEGFGASTPGGRGGRVLFVTNLDDYVPGSQPPIPGSFRAACAAKGKRFILFRTSGTITLQAPLRICEPFVTIAGQLPAPYKRVWLPAGQNVPGCGPGPGTSFTP